VAEERERKIPSAQDEEDVEGHRKIASMADDSEAPSESGSREADDESDVEAHRKTPQRNPPY
jgi:hypothetical protein